MSTPVIKRPIQRKAVPTDSPLEAQAIACRSCGTILQPKGRMGPGRLEAIVYTCVNEEYGCNYEYTRTVPVQWGEFKGLPAKVVEVKVEPAVETKELVKA